MTKRQKKLYTHKCDLFRPFQFDVGENSLVQNEQIPDQPAYLQVPCYYGSKVQINKNEWIGHGVFDSHTGLDQWHFEANQEIKNGWFIRMSSDHPFQGQLWMVVSEPRITITNGRRRTNQCLVMAKRIK